MGIFSEQASKRKVHAILVDRFVLIHELLIFSSLACFEVDDAACDPEQLTSSIESPLADPADTSIDCDKCAEDRMRQSQRTVGAESVLDMVRPIPRRACRERTYDQRVSGKIPDECLPMQESIRDRGAAGNHGS